MNDFKKDYGQEISELVNKRDKAFMELAQAKLRLIELGVKTIEGNEIFHLPGLDVNKFLAWNRQEFSWEAEYDNGEILKQFTGKKQYHFGHIEKDRLAKFRWVSCFDYQTDNQEKRVIVEIDFLKRQFNFLNGFVPQEVKTECFNNPMPSSCKLIMKMVRRESITKSIADNKLQGMSIYNRYLIGWESANQKFILCIEPNGFIHPWHEV